MAVKDVVVKRNGCKEVVVKRSGCKRGGSEEEWL